MNNLRSRKPSHYLLESISDLLFDTQGLNLLNFFRLYWEIASCISFRLKPHFITKLFLVIEKILYHIRTHPS